MLTASHLDFKYSKKIVLEDICMELRTGEIVALLGPNGAGKTTLLKLMARQLAPTAGDVIISGQNIHGLNRSTLAQRISLMPQYEQREAFMSVYDVVALGRVPHRGWLMPLNQLDRIAIDQALEATGLSGMKDQAIGELSGGEWRRMILARSLAQDASILLLDEPTAGLDLKYQLECLGKVQQLTKARELITVCSLHDLNQAATFADRIAILAEHRVMILGTPEEVLTRDWVFKAFGVDVTIVPHPRTGKPIVVSDWQGADRQ